MLKKIFVNFNINKLDEKTNEELKNIVKEVYIFYDKHFLQENLKLLNFETLKQNELIEHIMILNDRISFIENENIELNNRIVVLENQKKYFKYIIILQDLNDYYQLEKTFTYPYSKYIRKVHVGRLLKCHYLLDNDITDLIEYKKYLIKENLKNIPTECINYIDTKYGVGICNEVINFINKKTYTYDLTLINKIDIEIAEEWWSDDL